MELTHVCRHLNCMVSFPENINFKHEKSNQWKHIYIFSFYLYGQINLVNTLLLYFQITIVLCFVINPKSLYLGVCDYIK